MRCAGFPFGVCELIFDTFPFIYKPMRDICSGCKVQPTEGTGTNNFFVFIALASVAKQERFDVCNFNSEPQDYFIVCTPRENKNHEI